MFWTTGTQYQGAWKDNKKHGKGIMVYRNKDKYEGGWVENKREGLGTLWVYDGGKYRVRYHGHWLQNKFSGKGTFYNDRGECYVGEWLDGLREGKGKQTYGGRAVDGYGGDVYEGEWKQDQRSGKGTLFMANEDVYEGEWLNDLKHGKGTYFYTVKARRYDGVWKEGVPKAGSLSNMDPADRSSLPYNELADAGEVQRRAENSALAAKVK